MMTVRDLKDILERYDDCAEVVILGRINGHQIEFDPDVGSDEPGEGSDYCRICF